MRAKGVVVGASVLSLLALSTLAPQLLSRSATQRSELLSPSASQHSIHLNLDSAQAKKVVESQKKVDSLSKQLKAAQLNLAALSNSALNPSASQLHTLDGLSASGLSAKPLSGQEAEGVSAEVKRAQRKVDHLARALTAAQKNLNSNVNLMIGAKRPSHKGKRASKAVVSQLAERPKGPGAESLKQRAAEALAADMKALEAEKAKKLKEKEDRNVGIDVTPSKKCHGHGCDINLYMNIASPKIDHLARKGHWYKPTLTPLRKQLQKSGNLRLSYGKAICPPGQHGWSHGKCVLEPPTGYNFEYVPPGGHVAVGGEAFSGHKHRAFTHDERHRHHGFHTHDARLEKHNSIHDTQYKWQVYPEAEGQGVEAEHPPAEHLGSEIVPAAEKLAEEQKSLQKIAKDVESAADLKAEAAAKEARIVHKALGGMWQGAEGLRAKRPAAEPAKRSAPQPLIKLLPLESQGAIAKQAIRMASGLPLSTWQQGLDLFTPSAPSATSSKATTSVKEVPKMSLKSVEHEESELKDSIYKSLSLISPTSENDSLKALAHHYSSAIAKEESTLHSLNPSAHGPIAKIAKSVSGAKKHLALSHSATQPLSPTKPAVAGVGADAKLVQDLKSELYPGSTTQEVAVAEHSALSTQHSALSTQHSALSTQHLATLPPYVKEARGLASLVRGQAAESQPSQAVLSASAAEAEELARGLYLKVKGLRGRGAEGLRADLSALETRLSH